MENRWIYYGTGRRKTAIARVWVKPGTGNVLVNDRSLDEYFPREAWKIYALEPLKSLGKEREFDIYVNVSGGGLSGQAGAIRLGIARALLQYDPNLKSILKEKDFLTRDSRMKERKKYGRMKARRLYQSSKR
ncbi:MAG: 30S ribosomal protein S9 [Synergistetes bacterium]|nr:30S ribosomal protein S9 [Synergistota bacterium]MCX8127849.1 30S ribosomal protein S9 [Synergistota bacterium]MDW8192111.1 30S ribosomal protein S9 [Synergistota bacterium]